MDLAGSREGVAGGTSSAFTRGGVRGAPTGVFQEVWVVCLLLKKSVARVKLIFIRGALRGSRVSANGVDGSALGTHGSRSSRLLYIRPVSWFHRSSSPGLVALTSCRLQDCRTRALRSFFFSFSHGAYYLYLQNGGENVFARAGRLGGAHVGGVEPISYIRGKIFLKPDVMGEKEVLNYVQLATYGRLGLKKTINTSSFSGSRLVVFLCSHVMHLAIGRVPGIFILTQECLRILPSFPQVWEAIKLIALQLGFDSSSRLLNGWGGEKTANFLIG